MSLTSCACAVPGQITDYSAANEYYHRIMAEPNVKAQVDIEYYRNEKERIAKAFKVCQHFLPLPTHTASHYWKSSRSYSCACDVAKASTVLKYFHTKCETVIHNIKHTLGSRENMADYFSHPKVRKPGQGSIAPSPFYSHSAVVV
jgi:hypothetical protein